MAAYVDFTFYTNEFFGTAIASADFGGLALRASAEIDLLTYDRAAVVVTKAVDLPLIEKIKFATCAVAEELQRQDSAGRSDEIVSERVGQHQVTYAGGSLRDNPGKISDKAKVYLGNTGLMFAGIYSDED